MVAVLKRILSWLHIQSKGSMLTPGSQAPAFDLQDHKGRRVRLSDFSGKRVVLWFYPKADTPG
jgi:peroxiredoxin Q/BCP